MRAPHSSPPRRDRAWVALALLLPLLILEVPTAWAADNAGFLYGRVLTDEDGEYEGYLRWGRQEAFWDDLFHSLKTELPARDDVDADEIESAHRKRGGKVEMWGMRIRWSTDKADVRRMFIARFGDIAILEPNGDGEARVEMRDGSRFDVAGYSDDVSARIRIVEATGDEREIAWDHIDRIEFEPAPANLPAPSARLYGVVRTRSTEWTGYVMWDKEECLTTDMLDGKTRDGEVSLEMGRIRSIERRGSSRSLVELVDGTRLKLRGTNDVDKDNRGIMVEVEGLGKITIPWDEFESFEREDHDSSGRGYDDYAGGGALRGTVADVDGRTYTGRLVLDLDEARSFELLNGSVGELLFDVPLANVAVLEPLDERSCRVELLDGSELELFDGQDVSDRNAGLLIYEDADAAPVYVAWPQVETIRFAH